jgi:hypothetical protein
VNKDSPLRRPSLLSPLSAVNSDARADSAVRQNGSSLLGLNNSTDSMDSADSGRSAGSWQGTRTGRRVIELLSPSRWNYRTPELANSRTVVRLSRLPNAVFSRQQATGSVSERLAGGWQRAAGRLQDEPVEQLNNRTPEPTNHRTHSRARTCPPLRMS